MKLLKCQECGKELTEGTIGRVKKAWASDKVQEALCKDCYSKPKKDQNPSGDYRSL